MTTGCDAKHVIVAGRAVYYRVSVQDIREFQTAIAARLLKWSVPSTIVGGLCLLAPWPAVQGFGLQALIWGTIDSIIALTALYTVYRRSRRYPDEYRDIAETARTRRLLRINGRLDTVYVLGGVALIAVCRTDPFFVGNGIGIVVQGLFLLLFDRVHASRLPSNLPPWYDPSP